TQRRACGRFGGGGIRRRRCRTRVGARPDPTSPGYLMTLFDYLIPFALALGLLILIHELGHYLVARWCGVKVLRFSIGFGKPLILRRAGRDGTEWALAAFPL